MRESQEYLEAIHAFRRAVEDPRICPRCRQPFTGAICPTPGCSEPDTPAGPLTLRASVTHSHDRFDLAPRRPPEHHHPLRDHEANDAPPPRQVAW